MFVNAIIIRQSAIQTTENVFARPKVLLGTTVRNVMKQVTIMVIRQNLEDPVFIIYRWIFSTLLTCRNLTINILAVSIL